MRSDDPGTLVGDVLARAALSGVGRADAGRAHSRAGDPRAGRADPVRLADGGDGAGVLRAATTPAPVSRVVPAEAPFRSGPLPLPPVVRVAPTHRTPRALPRVASPIAQSGLAAAQACLQPARAEAEVRACIVNALRTRASTEPERRLLCVTYIDQEDRGSS